MESLLRLGRVGPLVVDPRDVVSLELDTGNCGPSCCDQNETTWRVCCCETSHLAAPAVTLSEHCLNVMRPEVGKMPAQTTDQQR